MIIECPNCGASGKVDMSKRPPHVNSVLCGSCQTSIPLDPIPAPPIPEAQPIAPAPAPAAAIPPAPPSPPATCALCRQDLPRAEMVRFGQDWVCPACKPDYVARLHQGLGKPGEMRFAGFWIRFAAKILDGIVLGIISMALTMVLGFIGAGLGDATAGILLAFGSFLLQIGVSVAYAVYFLTKHRATPGKMACGLIVVTPERETLSAPRAAGRVFAEWVSSIILGIGYLMAAFDDQKRALHDRMCGSRVAYK